MGSPLESKTYLTNHASPTMYVKKTLLVSVGQRAAKLWRLKIPVVGGPGSTP